MIGKTILLVALFVAVASAATSCAYQCQSVGQSCTSVANTVINCNGDSYCSYTIDGTSVTGTCRAPFAAGTNCSVNGLKGACARNYYCADNLACTAVNYVAEGATCDGVANQCRNINNDCVSGKCTKPVAIGQSCTVSAITGQDNCNDASVCSNSVCVQQFSVAVGAACTSTLQCTAGAYCDGTGKCVAIAASSNQACNDTSGLFACPNVYETCTCGDYSSSTPKCVNALAPITSSYASKYIAMQNCLYSSSCAVNSDRCDSCKSQVCDFYSNQAGWNSNLAYYTCDGGLATLKAYCNSAASVVASFALIFVALLAML